MPPPTFGVREPFRHPAQFSRHLLHRRQVGVHPLTRIQPPLLTLVTSERGELGRVYRRRVHERAGNDGLAQTISQAVRHRVIHRDVVIEGPARRCRAEVRHPVREGRRHRQSAGVHVVLHVILRRMGEHDRGLHRAHHRRHAPQRRHRVENLQIIGDWRVPLRAENPRCRLRFPPPHRARARWAHLHAPAVARGKVETMNLPPALLELEQRAGHAELDVVRMSGDGESDWRRCTHL